MSESSSSPRQTDLLQRMWPWVRPHWRTFTVCLLLLFFESGARMLGPILLQQAIDHYILPGDFSGLVLLMGGYILLLAAGFWANYWELIQLETVGQRMIADIKNRAFRHLLNLDLPFFDQSTTGKLVSRIENDANAMKVLFTSVMTHLISNGLLMIGMFSIMAWQYDLRLAAWIVGLCPLMLIAALFFNRMMAPRLVKVRAYVAEVNSFLTEMIQGITTIQVFARESETLHTLQEHSWNKYRLERFTNIAFNAFFNLLFFMQTVGIVLVLWIGGQQVLAGTLTLGSLILFMTFIRNFFVPIMFLSAQFSEFQRGMAGASRLFELLDEQPHMPVVSPTQLLSEGIQTIEFKGVWFRYQEDGEWVLKDINFICPAGEHWAIVGPTGSGKTTLINLLFKFYAPQKGQILINGIDLTTISHMDIRHHMGLVLQDTLLFPGSIKDNLLLGLDIPDSQLELAMQEIGLSAIIQKQPQGFDTELQENAHNFSTGEKQLISFGRALLHNPSLLILDEATSHIDPETERRIQKAMRTLLQGRTAFIIAHRLNTIRHADRILVLRYGELLEMGSHQELLAHQGLYAELHSLQQA